MLKRANVQSSVNLSSEGFSVVQSHRAAWEGRCAGGDRGPGAACGGCRDKASQSITHGVLYSRDSLYPGSRGQKCELKVGVPLRAVRGEPVPCLLTTGGYWDLWVPRLWGSLGYSTTDLCQPLHLLFSVCASLCPVSPLL